MAVDTTSLCNMDGRMDMEKLTLEWSWQDMEGALTFKEILVARHSCEAQITWASSSPDDFALGMTGGWLDCFITMAQVQAHECNLVLAVAKISSICSGAPARKKHFTTMKRRTSGLADCDIAVRPNRQGLQVAHRLVAIPQCPV